MIKLAEQLTYRQLCIMSVVVWTQVCREKKPSEELVQHAISLGVRQMRRSKCGARGVNTPELHMYSDCYALYTKGLLDCGQEVVFGPSDICPSALRARSMGLHLWALMRLIDIPGDHLRPVIVEFSR